MRWAYLAIPASVWASWAAWRGPPPTPTIDVPQPLSREVSAEARATQRAVAARLTAQIQAAMSAGPVPLSALYAENGTVLDAPIPDNPLVPGVGHVIEHCGAGPNPATADWWYCEETGELRPGLSQ